MSELNNHLQARKASLHEQRQSRHLFVWGDLGRWMVVDAEAALLIRCFAERRPVRDALAEYARLAGKPFEIAAAEALPVIDGLVARGILGSPPPPAQPPDDPLVLSNLTLNLTNRCNLRCPWCYNPRTDGDRLPVSDLARWIRSGAQSLDSGAALMILGGEPFLDQPRLLDTIHSVREYFPGEALVSTNGTRLDPATPPELARASATVQVSIDAPSAEQHDAVRGRGVFDRAVATTKRLADAGVHTVLSMVITRGGEEQFEPYFDLAAQIGADEVRFIPLRRIGQGNAHADSAPDLFAAFDRLVALLRRRPELTRFVCRDFFSILITACRYSRLRTNCGIGRRFLFVDADGSIFPCPNHRRTEHRCGHVRTTPLATLFESSPTLEGLRSRFRLEAMPVCRECTFRFWCAGDCRAEAATATGDPTAPSPYCRQLQRVMREMFWLIAEPWQGLGNHNRPIRPWS